MSVNVEMVPGTTLEQTDRVVHQVAERLRHEPNVENLYERAGVGNGRVLVIFKEKRTETSDQFTRRLAPDLLKIPDARVG
ncbi:efflux RND transporter permease subunit, partial [Escherichia coli]|nr:efflux RND transporter permease subunit [Escherichia coli]